MYQFLAGFGAQSRTDTLHMSVRLFFAPLARPANQGIVHLICSNKARTLYLVIKCIGKVVCISQALELSKLLAMFNSFIKSDIQITVHFITQFKVLAILEIGAFSTSAAPY